MRTSVSSSSLAHLYVSRMYAIFNFEFNFTLQKHQARSLIASGYNLSHVTGSESKATCTEYLMHL